MKLVVFGLAISSSWGNGHATLWRGLCKALARRGHKVVFFERDAHYYAAHRDLFELPGGALVLYPDWESARARARVELADADVAMITSYCPDAIEASEIVFESGAELRVFYDLDTPVTLSSLKSGKPVDYIGPRGLRDFDLVLSYTGGEALVQLRQVLGAQRVATLYGSVDPDVHRPVSPRRDYACDMSYLGTYAEDRQAALLQLFIDPSRRLPHMRFLIGGAQYPQDFPWNDNIYFVSHLPPSEHPAFFCSSRLTLNITRGAMAELGFCPSGRLFEAAACGVPIMSDWWEGLDQFFQPGSELLIGRTPDDTLAALNRGPSELAQLVRNARERVLTCHTADHRVAELEKVLAGIGCRRGEEIELEH